MRKLIFTSLTAIALLIGGTSFISYQNTQSSVETEFLDCKYGQCQATAKSTGQRCKHCVSNEGDKYCYQHD